MFKRTPLGYAPKTVMATVHNLEAKVEELRTVVTELEADNVALRRERPREVILEARWEAEKIRLAAHAEAAETLRLAAFRRDLIVATADRDLTAVDLTAYDEEESDFRVAG